jgi:D-alanyl-D-alanine dipeptidase
MGTRLSLVALLLAGMTTALVGQSSSPRRLAADARQLLLVTTPGWDEVDGTLRRYERDADAPTWRQVGADIPIVVGRSGLAWDAAWRDPKPVVGPTKKEGDGRSPAGIFTLTSAFGYDPAAAWTLILPYRQVTAVTQCVDDVRSRYYNRILDRSDVTPDWSSSEDMRRADEFYRLGVVIDYNAPTPVAGQGSCIFLHIWNRPGDGTAGCTAMNPDAMREVAQWLDPAAQPVLAQFPRDVLDKLRRTWRLP